MIIVVLFNGVTTADALPASNNDVKRVETKTVHFEKLKLSYRFERINKLDRDHSYWQSLFFCLSLEYHMPLLLSHRSYSIFARAF